MRFIGQPWQVTLVVLAGWVNREQQRVIEYLRAENDVLRERIGKKRMLLTDEQRRRLAVKAKLLTRKTLEEIGTIVRPDTLLRWHRLLVARKWDYSDQRKGRPRVKEETMELVLRLARENPSWGYDRIQAALANLGITISDSTVANILKRHGIEPAPRRKRATTWKTFLRAHWDVLAAVDFTTVEVWTKGGLVTYLLLFAMELSTRRVALAGLTASPHDEWMRNTARELTNSFDGFLSDKKYVLMDRDTKFSEPFRALLSLRRVTAVRLPPRSPNLNAHLERFMRSLKEECLNRMIFYGEDSLHTATREYLAHYHAERNHQGLDNHLIDPGEEVGRTTGEVQRRERLGGLLNYYRRAA